ncbi:MAG TPA: homoserine dehydrogenase, partial [Thermoguttaceae bacterium]|nr:homoserine dehydrogenase [Thermoguttaceae bacterium]
MKPVRVAIIGFGTIGSGVAKLLLEERERLARQVGRPVELARVVDVDLERRRNVQLPSGLLTDQLSAVLEDPEIQIAVELVGGLEPARTIVLRLLAAGKDVVTANKALLAEHGTELFEAARKHGRSIAFEASVAGGIPIIAAIAESLTANQIQSINGILNGTSNFILTQMEEQAAAYADAVRTAQQLGYAEANPSLDVNGTDAAQKLAILAHLAFGVRVRWQEIPRTGIDTVESADMKYAAELGYTIKLLAVAELVSAGRYKLTRLLR